MMTYVSICGTGFWWSSLISCFMYRFLRCAYTDTSVWTEHWRSEWLVSGEVVFPLYVMTVMWGSWLNKSTESIYTLRVCQGHICTVSGFTCECFLEYCLLSLGLTVMIVYYSHHHLWKNLFLHTQKWQSLYNSKLLYLDLCIFYKWALCSWDTCHYRGIPCHILVSWSSSQWPIIREEHAGKACYRK